MTPLVTSAFAADLDRRTQEALGVPQAALMENAAAGMEAALDVLGLLGLRGAKRGAQGTLTALVGRGSNGGDALAVLRRLAFRARSDEKPDLAVILSSGEPAGLAAEQLQSVRACGARVLAWEGQEEICRALLEDSSVVLDGIAGTGLSGPLRPRERSLAEAVNASGATVVAVDVPSGAGDFFSEGAAVVKAAATLCVEPRKVCVYRPALRPFAGRILPIAGVFPNGSGSESPYRLLEPGDIADLVPPLRPEAHKYERGHCLVFAGAPGTTGAAVLAARGATAGGAGLVTLHVRPEIWNTAASQLAGEIVKPLSPDPGDLDLGKARAAVVGPGWGRDETAAAILRRLWASSLALVVDADALALLKDLGLQARQAPTVLTPHPGEASALSGRPTSDFMGAPEEAVADIGRRYGAVVVLKSCVSWISRPSGGYSVYDGMDGSLAVGGSGDVLAGLCGALLARGLEAYDAARAAVLAHGGAGHLARGAAGIYGAQALPPMAARILGGLDDR